MRFFFYEIAMFLTFAATALITPCFADGLEFTLDELAQGKCSITWEWNSADTIDGFKIYRTRPEAINPQVIDVLSNYRKLNCSRFTIKQPGQSFISVAAYRGSVESEKSTAVPFVTLPNPPPSTPANVAVQRVTGEAK